MIIRHFEPLGGVQIVLARTDRGPADDPRGGCWNFHIRGIPNPRPVRRLQKAFPRYVHSQNI